MNGNIRPPSLRTNAYARHQDPNLSDLLSSVAGRHPSPDPASLSAYPKTLVLVSFAVQNIPADIYRSNGFVRDLHNDRVHPDSLIHNGIGKKELLEILVEMKKRMSH